MAHERALRMLSLGLAGLTTPLLIATTVVSLHINYDRWHPRPATSFCFGYLPLALGAFASAASLYFHRRNGRLPGGRFALLDLLAAVMYLSVLIPIWKIEISELREPGFGLLVGYLTAPMIVNMFIHFYIAISNARAIWSSFVNAQVQQCPNCHSTMTVRGTTQVEKTNKGGEGYSLLRGEDYLDADADAVQYTGVRDSVEEQIHPDCDEKEQGKSKAIIDV